MDNTFLGHRHAHNWLAREKDNGQVEETKMIITNAEIIAVNQDPAGSPVNQRWKKPVNGGELQLWTGGLANG